MYLSPLLTLAHNRGSGGVGPTLPRSISRTVLANIPEMIYTACFILVIQSINMASVPHATSQEESKATTAVALDLDETTGAWGAGSLAFKMCHEYAGRVPPIAIFVDYYLERGGARPWLKQLLKTLEEWKRIGRIDEVAIFTSASNSNGWVTFLKECMELYAETPGLFGPVSHARTRDCSDTMACGL